ncbi:NADH-dependent flavin oxidoreductase [Elsinoe australis]|uniref:NADH-dependent flavin oxidoreductase n=1 Tax=Elsinoe australis TaxID=40998 RepID=A0A4U7B336_9PEZI|nr:NADH-dependent flavin oxidoreductase [Elsinoe australis]
MSALHISKPMTLPCGLTLPNRLVKAAMAEKMAEGDSLPNDALNSAYQTWADGGWGMIMTGNVQIDANYLNGPGDVTMDKAVTEARRLETWKGWASATQRGGSPAIVQINHPGRQSPMGAGKKGLMGKNVAPSAVPLRLGDGLLPRMLSSLLFGTPKEMTKDDIKHVIQGFTDTAKLAADSGFAGVEIHAAHGYLLAQFLSDETNKRTDEYGGSAKARAKIIVEIIEAIRAVVPSKFCVGIKFNSVDHQSADALKGCIEQLQMIVEAGVDFLEISGGSYENPTMNTGVQDEKKSERTKAREAFFLEFARRIRQDISQVPLIVTGGFRTRSGMEAAVSSQGCDMVGIGRPAVLSPTLPKDIVFDASISDEDAVLRADKIETPWLMRQTRIKAIGAGVENTWYSNQIGKMHQVQQKVR